LCSIFRTTRRCDGSFGQERAIHGGTFSAV
jgi:hypothetical protein